MRVTIENAPLFIAGIEAMSSINPHGPVDVRITERTFQADMLDVFHIMICSFRYNIVHDQSQTMQLHDHDMRILMKAFLHVLKFAPKQQNDIRLIADDTGVTVTFPSLPFVFNVKRTRDDPDWVSLPADELECIVQMDSLIFSKLIDRLVKKFFQSISFFCDASTRTVTVAGYDDPDQERFLLEVRESDTRVKSTFTSTISLKALHVFAKKAAVFSKSVTISMAPDVPMQFEYFGNECSLKFYIAPRIEVE